MGVGRREVYFRPSRFRLSVMAGIFAVALISRLAILHWTKSYLSPEGTEVVRIAQSLTRYGRFANAYGQNTGFTAHCSPIYPILLSWLFRFFGTGVKGEFAQEVFSCTLASLQWAMLPLLATVSGVGFRTGVWAGLAGALLPINRWAETKGSFETTLAALALAGLFTYVMYCWRARKFSLGQAIIMGTLSGWAILVSATLASAAAALLLCGYLFLRAELRKQYLWFVIVSVAGAAAVLFPWALRNCRTLGGFVWTRSNFGLELQVSNNDLAKSNFTDNEVAMFAYHPHENPSERTKLRSMGELPYERQKQKQAVRWIASHPGRFARLTLTRIVYFWFPKMKQRLQSILLALITLCAVAGWFCLRRDSAFTAYAILAILFAFPLVYYVVQAQSRYVYPIEWTLYFLSACGVSKILELRAPKSRAISSCDSGSSGVGK